MKHRIISIGTLSLFAIVLCLTAGALSGNSEETALKCWKCGHAFTADESETMALCPKCNMKCMVPQKQSSTTEGGEEEVAAPESGQQAEVITWQEAMNRKGRYVVVEAKITNVYDPDKRGKKGPVKLNVTRDYRSSLTFVLFNRGGKFGNPARFMGKTVQVRGTVGEYKGATQIKVEKSSDIKIVEPSAAPVVPAEEPEGEITTADETEKSGEIIQEDTFVEAAAEPD